MLEIVLERMKLAASSLVELHNRMVEDSKVPAEYPVEIEHIVKRMEIPTKKDRP